MSKLAIGSAIDQILDVLEPFDEKGRKTILATVCTHLEVSIAGAATSPHGAPPMLGALDAAAFPAASQSPATPTDIRILKSQKGPTNAIQMACLVAFYLQELAPQGERRATVKVEDIEKYFKQAPYKLPSRPAQLLVDTKSAGYFDSAGKGEYRLNSVGYNLVAHTLPMQAAK